MHTIFEGKTLSSNKDIKLCKLFESCSPARRVERGGAERSYLEWWIRGGDMGSFITAAVFSRLWKMNRHSRSLTGLRLRSRMALFVLSAPGAAESA